MTETILTIETNLDDLSPELVGYVLERALAAGALDAYATPVQMKKHRPGVMLTLLARPERREDLVGLLLRETSTLGVRVATIERVVVARRTVQVETAFGLLTVKLAGDGAGGEKAAPEYEECRAAALRFGVPLREVYEAARRACVPG